MQKIDLRNYLDQRLPIGVVLLALAAFCVWRGRGPDGLDWLIFGLCVGFFGLLAVGERYFVIIDRQAGVLIKKRGIVFAFTVRSLAIADLECVTLSAYSTKNKGKSSNTTRYRLSVTGPKSGGLGDYGDEWYARRVGERLSAALGIPFDNRVYDRRSVRKSDELDLPLAERWRVAEKIKERPTLPAFSRLTIDDLGTELHVHVPVPKSGLQALAGMFCFFALLGALFYYFAEAPSEYVFFYGFFGLAFVFCCVGALAFSGRSRLTFTDREITFRQGRAPMERSIELHAIEELICGWGAIYLVGDAARLAIDLPESKADKDFLVAFVAYEIARRYSPEFAPSAPTNMMS